MKCILDKQSILFFISFLFIAQIFSQNSDPLLSFSYFPDDLSLNCSDEVPSVIDYPIVLLDTANTDCNDILTLSFDDIVVDGGCPNSYIVERVWSAGICGETISDIQIFSFLDTSSPTIISPVDGSHVCETDPAMSLFPAAQDNCQLTVLLNFELVETVICEGITKRDYTITASDSCGNTTTETRSVYIHDIAPPTFLSVPIDQTLSCTESVNLESATYDCSIGMTYTEGANVSFPDCSGSFVQTQTYSLTDMCASTTNASRVITVVDDIPPILYAPEDFVVSCPDVPVLEFATAFDECSNEIINVIEVVDTVISNCGLFTLVRTFSATDDCGNTSTAIQTITVTDTTPPVFSFIPSDLSFDCADEIPSDEELGMAIASDECSEVIITVSEVITSAVCPLTYLRERIFTAVDSCGNSVSATQTITVTDNTPPQIVVSSDTVDAECGDNLVNNLPDIIDDCSEFTVSTSVSYLPEGTCPGQAISTFTYTVTDACGNVNSATKSVVITDNSPPTFLSIPPDIVLSCGSDIPLDLPTHSDVCSSSTLTETQSEVLGECLGERIVTRTFTITDLCGNFEIAQQTVSFVDSTSPVLTIPEDYTAECSDAHPMDDASATDNCGEVTIDVVETTLSGACAGDYTITREFTATDDCGNATSATQTITIVDTTSPEFTFVPEDYTAECSDVHPMDDASATDDCGEVTIDVVETTLAGACAGDYTITRAFTATDDCGNATSATQTITIVDTTAPIFTISPPTLIEVFWVDGDIISMPVAEIDDNCDSAPSMSVSESSTTDESPGSDLAQTITYVYLATDDCQNSSSYTSTVIYYPQIMGCIDSTACNYNPVANDDDGSCVYYDVFGICDGDNSLQAAIDATIAVSLEGGSNILSVPSGTYLPVSIPSSIVLQAEAGATIDASGLLIGISISGPSVTIDGLTIIGDGSTVAGIEIVSGADNAVIRNCDISGMALANPSNESPLSYGILCYQNDANISPVSGTLIEGNTIHNVAGAAISLATNGAVGVQISQNTFSYISPVFFEGEFISIGVQAVSISDLNVFDNSFDMVVGATSILLSTAVNVYDNSYSGVTALHAETTSDDAAFSCDSYWARAEVDIPGNINVLRVYFANLDGNLSNPGAFTFANDGSEVVDSNGETYVQDCNGVWDGPGIMTFCGCDIFDEDDDGICPVDEVAGCTDLAACNFNPLATDEDGSCTEDPIGFDCDGNLVPNEFCGFGTVWNSETGTCEVISLVPACYFDTNLNGAVDSGDLLNLLSAYGLPCE